jgi:hypothetical protein
MPADPAASERDNFDDGAFRTTRWSLIQRAAGGSGLTVRGEALGELLRRYVPAMRSHLVMRLRLPADRADDLLQGFIVRKILEYDLVSRASPTRGKFRTLLLTSLDNYVRTELGRKQRETGAEVPEELPDDDANAQPGADFDVPWAQAMVTQASELMRKECTRTGRDDIWGVFDARILAPTLRDEKPMEYTAIVERFGFDSPAQASNVLITGKRMFERVLRSLVAEYAEDEAEVESEIADLREVLSRAGG